jgi:hypothetical protein
MVVADTMGRMNTAMVTNGTTMEIGIGAIIIIITTTIEHL